MKTLLLSILAVCTLQLLQAQTQYASADGVPPYEPGPAKAEKMTAQPSIAAYSHTVNEMAVISLGKGFREDVNLQVITPSTDVLVNQKIPAGQKRVRVDLSGMEAGTYTVRVKTNDKTWIKQVVKE